MKKEGVCCLCGGPYENYGNNPHPLGSKSSERCCDTCNGRKVIPARIDQMWQARYDRKNSFPPKEVKV